MSTHYGMEISFKGRIVDKGFKFDWEYNGYGDIVNE